MNVEFDLAAVNDIEHFLDSARLHRSADELVVIGGAAMAAYGIKKLASTDLDIAVSDDLRERLSLDPTWLPSTQANADELVAKNKGTERKKRAPDTYAGYVTVSGDITAITPPMQDSTYMVETSVLIAERITPEGSKYGFSPIARLLDWKLELATNPEFTGDKDKHFTDCLRISKYLLKLTSEAKS